MSASLSTLPPSPTLGALVGAEVAKLASRSSVRLGLLAVAMIAVGVPLLALLATQAVSATPPAGSDAPDPTALSMPTVVGFVISLRGLFVFRATVLAVVAVSFAGEFVARTLREDLVRPVSRATVLAAKWLALQVYVAAGMLLPLVLAVPLAGVFFGGTEGFAVTLRSAALQWVGDVGWATLVMALSIGLRSVVGTVGGVFLVWVLEQLFVWAVWGIEQLRVVVDGVLKPMGLDQALKPILDGLVALRPWMPSAAFGLTWPGTGETLVWQSYAAFVVITGASYLAALTIFQRIDVD
ncbi:MAG: ABC transporter permease [Alphaproteobacteria bacterium]|nr:ABC transporter permease [Alphaproteobacteria bacterium]